MNGKNAAVQVFESTRGLKNGDSVEFEDKMLEVTLGPGLLSSCYDGLQNDLTTMTGVFLKRGEYTDALNHEKLWEFTPLAKAGDKVIAADWLGNVKEGWLDHKIMVPFSFKGEYTVKSIAGAGEYNVDKVIAVLVNEEGEDVEVTMTQRWPVKVAIKGAPARHSQAGRRRRHSDGSLRRTCERGCGDIHRVPGTHRPSHRTPPHGAYHYYMQHLEYACRRP